MERTGISTAEDLSPLGEALERGDSYIAELKSCDPAVAKSLIAAWKEQVIENLVQLFAATNDPRDIQHVDLAIGVSRRNFNWEQSRPTRREKPPS